MYRSREVGTNTELLFSFFRNTHRMSPPLISSRHIHSAIIIISNGKSEEMKTNSDQIIKKQTHRYVIITHQTDKYFEFYSFLAPDHFGADDANYFLFCFATIGRHPFPGYLVVR